MPLKKVLIGDDDPHIREVISFALKKSHYDTIEAENGLQILELFHQYTIDAIILDISMPEMEGTDVCKEIRKTSNVPILFVSAKDSEFDRVLCLELGGDDYIQKPFSLRELVARLRAVLRRSHPNHMMQSENEYEMMAHGCLSMDIEKRIVRWNQQILLFTSTEFEILRTMLQHPGRVYNRDSLMDGAYANNISVSDRTIDSHLRRIRAKFKNQQAYPIETVHGVGYKINDCLSNETHSKKSPSITA
jgi:two-component system OmpR family response regulator